MKLPLYVYPALLMLFVSTFADAAGVTLVASPSYAGPGGGGYHPAPIQAPGQFNGGAINMPSRAAPVPPAPPAPILRPRR